MFIVLMDVIVQRLKTVHAERTDIRERRGRKINLFLLNLHKEIDSRPKSNTSGNIPLKNDHSVLLRLDHKIYNKPSVLLVVSRNS